MRIYADCGATKSRWIASDSHKTETFTGRAINGSTMRKEEISDAIREAAEALSITGNKDDLSCLSFDIYAAGAIGKGRDRIVDAMREVFGRTPEVSVESDMVLAAKATLGSDSGIACILGTGSNTCKWDGANIVTKVPPLGYILGDEGSGASIGKRFVADYLKGLFSPELSARIKEAYPDLSVEKAVEYVYHHPGANTYLAGFMPFVVANIGEPELTELVDDEFERFFMRNITQYGLERNSSIGFSGGIAVALSERLGVACRKAGMRIKSIISDPLQAVMEQKQ